MKIGRTVGTHQSNPSAVGFHDTYRAVYTVRFAEVVYVLHAFQKKSKAGIKTPQDDVKLIGERLKRAQQDFERTRTP